MNQPLVSVIMPSFNHSKYIEKSIRSVINSNYNNIELLIIDDGSKDNSFEIARKILGGQNILTNYYLEKQENCGIVKTLNNLIFRSKGEYIALLASDDMLTPNGIEDRVLYLEKNKMVDAVFGRAHLMDQYDNVISLNASKYLYYADEKLLKSRYIKYELVLRWSAVGPCLLLRKNLYDKIGVYNEKYCVEDRDFYLRMLAINKIAYIDKVVSMYRIHNSNISRSRETKRNNRIQCANINIDNYKSFRSILLSVYLRSYKIDNLFLKVKFNIIYIVYKTLRYFIIAIYLYLLKINICKMFPRGDKEI